MSETQTTTTTPPSPAWGLAWTDPGGPTAAPLLPGEAARWPQRLRCCSCHVCLYFHRADRPEAVAMMIAHLARCGR